LLKTPSVASSPDSFGAVGSSEFDVFISYSRSVSTPLAVDLQRELERFAKKWNQLRAVRVFRDDSSMSANTALWSTIESALTTSNHFILISTPESAASDYVNNEVRWWIERKGVGSLLLVLAGGQLAWNNAEGGFTADSAVPPALRHAFPEEPRWIDMTWYGQPGSAGIADPRFEERVADLAAPVRGVDRDALIGANLAEHRKTMRRARIAIATLATLLVASLVASGVAVTQRNTAKKLFADSVGQRIAFEAAQILNGEVAGGPGRGLQQLLVAERLKAKPDPGAYLNAMIATAGIGKIATKRFAGAAISSDRIATGSAAVTGDIQIWDSELKPVGPTIQTGNDSYPKAFSHSGKLLAAGNDLGVVTVWDLDTGARRGSARLPVKDPEGAGVLSVIFSANDDGLVVRTRDNSVWFYSVETMQQTASEIPNVAWITAPADGSVVAVAPFRGDEVEIRNPLSGSLIGEPIKLPPTKSLIGPGPDPVEERQQLHYYDCRSFDDAGNLLLIKNDVYDLKTRELATQWRGSRSLNCIEFNARLNPDGTAILEGGNSIQLLRERNVSGPSRLLTVPSRLLTVGGPFPGVGWLDQSRAVALTSEGMLRLTLEPWNLGQATGAAFGLNEGDIAVQGSTGMNAGTCSDVECLVLFNGGSEVRPSRPVEGKLAGGSGETFSTVDLRSRTFHDWSFDDGSIRKTIRLVDSDRYGVCSLLGDPGASQNLALVMQPAGDLGSCERGGGTIRSWDLATGQRRPDIQVPENVQIRTFIDIDESTVTAFAAATLTPGDPGAIWTFDLVNGTSQQDYGFATEVAWVAKCQSKRGDLTWMIAEKNGDVGFVRGDLTEGVTWPKTRRQSGLKFGTARFLDDCRMGASWGGINRDPLQFWDVSTGSPLGNPIPGAELLTHNDDGRMVMNLGELSSILRVLPARPTANDLCAKLTLNMSRKQWDEWISPDIEYRKACPELAILPDE